MFAAIFRESDFTSPAKDFNLVSGDCPKLKFSGRDPNGVDGGDGDCPQKG